MKAEFLYDELNALPSGEFKMFYSVQAGDLTIYGDPVLDQNQVQAMFEATGWTKEVYACFNRQSSPDPTDTKWDFFMNNEFPILDPSDMAHICKKLWLLHFKSNDLKPLKETYEAVLNLV